MIALLLGASGLSDSNPPVLWARTPSLQNSPPPSGLADALAMIRELLDRGRGIEAENIARVLLTRVEAITGPDAVEVADVLEVLGRAIRQSSKVSEQEKTALAERALAIREMRLGPTDPGLAASLLNVGVQRALAGAPVASKPLIERALAIRVTAFGPEHELVAGPLQALGGVLLALHDDAGALVVLDRAQRILETAKGVHPARTIRTLVNLAILYQDTGDYTGARERYERALAVSEALPGSGDLLTLHVLTNAAVVLSDLGGDFDGAARLNERLLTLSERAYGVDDPRLLIPLENLAMDRRDLGDYGAAKRLAERSLAIAERAFGPQHAAVASNLHTLATIVAGLGDYGEAMRLFERATRINERVLSPANPEGARASWFIADLVPVSGYAADDLELFERVLAAREKRGGLGDPRITDSLSNLAALLSTAGDHARTRPLFERALASLEQRLGPDHSQVGSAATNLAHVLSRAGESAAARLLYGRAVSIWEKSLGPDHPKVATALLNLARLPVSPDGADVRPLVERALTIQLQRLGMEHPEVALTLTRLAELAARAGSTGEAFDTAARAEAISREHMRLAVRTLSEPQALAYAASGGAALNIMLSVAAQRPGGSATSRLAWEAVIRARGMVLDELAARHGGDSAADDQETAALARELASARQRLATTVVRGPRDDPPERHRHLLEQARLARNRAERDLAENSLRFRESLSRSHVGLPELSAALGADAALVAFVRYQRQNLGPPGATTPPALDGEPAYLAFVLRGGRSEPILVPLATAAKVEGLILQWRQQLDQEAMAGGRSVKRGEAAYRRVAGELRQQVWDPLRSHLSNATRVFMVPDGALHLVSFAALPTTTSGYLVETGPLIHYLSAERDLVPAETGRRAGTGLLVLGAPAFDASNPGAVAAAASFRGARSGCEDFQSMHFDPLPESLKEVDRVVSLWSQAHDGPPPPRQPRVAPPLQPDTVRLTGAAATESAFKSHAAGHRIVHLATHGFFLGGRCQSTLQRAAPSTPAAASARIARENPLVLSGLVLAGANHRDVAAEDQEDGILTAEEVAALDLSGVEWAVLSGCDTGGGEVRSGEGVFGLRRAFQLAGARTVIMSLWPVADQPTRAWMANLYESRLIRKRSSAAAVREASVAVLRERRANGLSGHPFHWAAFVAAGDWR